MLELLDPRVVLASKKSVMHIIKRMETLIQGVALQLVLVNSNANTSSILLAQCGVKAFHLEVMSYFFIKQSIIH